MMADKKANKGTRQRRMSEETTAVRGGLEVADVLRTLVSPSVSTAATLKE